jgi:diguanylate cyclase (GGDEF)-like protein
MAQNTPRPAARRPLEILSSGDGRWLLAGTLGIAAAAVVIGGGWLLALPPLIGILVSLALGFATLLGLAPWRRIAARQEREDEIRRLTVALRQISEGDREPLSQLRTERDDDLGALSRAMSAALVHATAHRIEAARLRATMDETIRRETDRATGRLQREATTDPLTGLGNRRALEDKLTAQVDAGRRSGRPLTALVIDIDRFKDINDGLGHGEGDRCLAFLGGVLRSGLRGGDRAYRIGGDEFLVIMPAQGSEIGETVAQRIAALFRQIPWPHEGVDRPTVSIGVATVLGIEQCDADEIIRRADEAMLAAKHGGRDRVVSYRELNAA